MSKDQFFQNINGKNCISISCQFAALEGAFAHFENSSQLTCL